MRVRLEAEAVAAILAAVDAGRVALVGSGYGDYGELRHELLGALSVDELLSRMRESKSEATRKPRRKNARATPTAGVPATKSRRAGRR